MHIKLNPAVAVLQAQKAVMAVKVKLQVGLLTGTRGLIKMKMNDPELQSIIFNVENVGGIDYLIPQKTNCVFVHVRVYYLLYVFDCVCVF